jgi:hypothetical protein
MVEQCRVSSRRGVAPIPNNQYPIHARESNYSINYPVFDRRSDEIVVIGLIPGSGPQSKAGFAVVPAVGILLRGTDFAWCFDPEIRLPRLALSDTVSSGSVKGVENDPSPKLPPLDPRSAPGLCGVSNAAGAGLAFAACVLSSGCVRTATSASLRRCAACSAFSAAAVVLATCGVTSSGRRTSSRSRARAGVLEGLPLSIFNFAMRDVRVETSSLCWRIARLMFRDVRFIVSSDGALERR